MIKKLRIKLTLICTFITGLILCVMAVSIAHLSETQLKLKYKQDFMRGFEEAVKHFETEPIIKYNWLVQFEQSNKGTLWIEENGVPFIFNGTYWEAKKREALVQTAKAYMKKNQLEKEEVYEFIIKDQEGLSYECALKQIKTARSEKLMLVIGDKQELSKQMLYQRGLFMFYVLIGELMLAIFSWWFVGHAIRPVAVARDKQTAFVAAASHELRSPITVIKTSLDVIKVGDEEEREKFVEIAQQETIRMTRLMNDLLLLANFDKKKIKEEPSAIQTAKILFTVYEMFEEVMNSNNQKLRLTFKDKELPPIWCDEHRLIQLLSILLDNAKTYTPKGGTVEIIGALKADRLLLQIADNGIGIADEYKEKIFDRFFSIDKVRSKKEHSGLGLSIAKEITAYYGWQLEATDTPGGGTTFTIVIPCRSVRN